MPNLKKLKIIFEGIDGIEASSYVSKYFVHLHQLQHLLCRFNDAYRNCSVEDFHLPLSLRKLTLRGCSLSSKTMEIIGSLPDLQVLNVQECRFFNKVWKPIEGEFDQLKSLLLDMTDLKHFKADETTFPNLVCLRIFLRFELRRIPSRIGDISTLQLIELDQRSKSVERSALRIRKEQEDMGNESLKIIIQKSDIYMDEDEDEEEAGLDDEKNENEEDTEDDDYSEEDAEDNEDREDDDDNEVNEEEEDEDDDAVCIFIFTTLLVFFLIQKMRMMTSSLSSSI